MATKTTFVVQAFVMKRGGVIAPGKQESSPSESGAIKRAEAWATRKKPRPAEAGRGQVWEVPDDSPERAIGM